MVDGELELVMLSCLVEGVISRLMVSVAVCAMR